MRIVVFGANGATGQLLVADALMRGHKVVAVTRRPDAFPVKDARVEIVRADATSGAGLVAAVSGCDAVASALGAAGYSRKPITVYSAGTKAIVSAMREAHCKRVVVVSSGLTYPPAPGHGFFVDYIIVPILHDRIGRTLYADMRAMEEFLRAQPDIDWTVIRPGRLINGDVGRPYVKVPDTPSGRVTTRKDLAKVILDEIESGADVHAAMAVTSASKQFF
jgi:nucleoside-diphosphate-sugar epimerase